MARKSKGWMIPPEYPRSDYEWAPMPKQANWTSYPTYSYEEFARSNPRGVGVEEITRCEACNKLLRRKNLAFDTNLCLACYNLQSEELPKRGKTRKKRKSRKNPPSKAVYTRQPQNAGPYLPEMFPYGVGGRPAKYEALNNPAGPYADVLRRYGASGFGVPSKAPNVGSFPVYPIGRARYALTIVTSPTYDSKQRIRSQVVEAALDAHPELESFWEAREKTITKRLRSQMKAAANPKRKKKKAQLYVGVASTRFGEQYTICAKRAQAVRHSSGDPDDVLRMDYLRKILPKFPQNAKTGDVFIEYYEDIGRFRKVK